MFPRCYFTKSRTSTAQEKKLAKGHHCSHDHAMVQKRKIPVTTVGLFIHQIRRSCVLIDVLYALRLLLSYSAILDFKKCANVSTIKFTDTLSEEELMECFLQFITNNFDYNEDTTTGVCTTHVMGLIFSQYPKSDTLSTQPIMKQTITSEKMIDWANVRGLVKMYERTGISKFKKTLVKACNPSQLDTKYMTSLIRFGYYQVLSWRNLTTCRDSWQT